MANCGPNSESTQHNLYNDPTQQIQIAILSSIQNQLLFSTYSNSSMRGQQLVIFMCLFFVHIIARDTYPADLLQLNLSIMNHAIPNHLHIDGSCTVVPVWWTCAKTNLYYNVQFRCSPKFRYSEIWMYLIYPELFWLSPSRALKPDMLHNIHTYMHLPRSCHIH